MCRAERALETFSAVQVHVVVPPLGTIQSLHTPPPIPKRVGPPIYDTKLYDGGGLGSIGGLCRKCLRQLADE